jgi:glycosyltransferase involved in cell wall biosynthesis
MAKIKILLATYNGAKYIVEQLESLANQTYRDFSLYIRDDGSTDGTVELICAWLKQNPTIDARVLENNNISLGYPECFFEILRLAGDGDFYSFCDQDDIWLPEKLEIAVNTMKLESQKIPLFFFSAFEYCDASMNLIKSSSGMPYLDARIHNVIFDLMEAFGFSVVINSELRKRLIESSPISCTRKDWWLLMMAAAMGKVLYSRKSLALYRRHPQAVTIVGTSSSLWRKWMRRTEGFLKYGDLLKIQKDLREFLEKYGSKMSQQDRDSILIFSGQSSLWRLRGIFFAHKLRRFWHEDVLYRILFVTS